MNHILYNKTTMFLILAISFPTSSRGQAENRRGQFMDTSMMILPVNSGTAQILISADTKNISTPLADSTTRNVSNSFNKKKVLLVTGTHTVLWTATYTALNKAWYKGYPKSNFHFFNDMNEWNGMDKAGHVWTAYQLSKASAHSWAFAGMNKKSR